MRRGVVVAAIAALVALWPAVAWVSGAETVAAFSKHAHTSVSADAAVTYNEGYVPDPAAVRAKDAVLKGALARSVSLVDSWLDAQAKRKRLELADVSMTMKVAEVWLDGQAPFVIREPTLVHFTKAMCSVSAEGGGRQRAVVDVSIALRAAPSRSEMKALLRELCAALQQPLTAAPAVLSFVDPIDDRVDAGTFQADGFAARGDLAGTFTRERARMLSRFRGIVTRAVAGLVPTPRPPKDAPEDYLRISDTEAPLHLDFKRFGKNDWLSEERSRTIRDQVWTEMRSAR